MRAVSTQPAKPPFSHAARKSFLQRVECGISCGVGDSYLATIEAGCGRILAKSNRKNRSLGWDLEGRIGKA